MSQDLICDFTSGAVLHRLKFGGGRGQALPKAIGMNGKNKSPLVVDATAGLGRDSFLMASLGAQVTMIERSKTMHDLLKNAIEHARSEGSREIADIMTRLTLIHGDAIEILPTLSPEVILIDPMHPPRKNSALVKKDMRLIRDIVGTDEDSSQLMQVALAHATNRVVLKWPQRADPMEGIRAPSHQIPGKTTRYDVFMA